MVETEENLVINSEESQTVFEGEQTFLQPPPLDEHAQEKKRKRTRNMLIVSGLLLAIITLVLLLSGADGEILAPKEEQAIATPAPVYIDPAKEAELQRVEAIVKSVNPEELLIPPPQVDMVVIF